MLKTFIYCLFALGMLPIQAQEDAWVYLKNKENVQQALANPTRILTQKAIARKAKHGIVIDARDVPVNESYINTLKNSTGITVMAKSKWFNAVHVRGSKNAINKLLTNDKINFIEQITFADRSSNGISSKSIRTIRDKFHFENTSVDFHYGQSNRQVTMINVNALHKSNHTGEGITIAVLDAGFAGVNTASGFSRARQAGKLLGGYDFVNRTNDVYAFDSRPQSENHGTQVLSTMAGYLENYVGTAPDATYYLFATEDPEHENPVEESYWVEAAERADSLGVDVINSSLGYLSFDDHRYDYAPSDMDGATAFITKGAKVANEKGLMIVVAAGNEGTVGVSAPADSPYVLTVGAVNPFGGWAFFSSIGNTYQPVTKPDVVAMGQSASVINTDGRVIYNNGTSFSSPITAGAVACLMQALPDKTNNEIIELIRQSSSLSNTPNFYYGYGIPDFQKALTTAKNSLSLTDESGVSLKSFPNPVTSSLQVELPRGTKHLKANLLNVFGGVVQSVLLTKQQRRIDMTRLASGVYFLVFDTTENIRALKIFKN